jgi:hypothetical protein
MSGRPPAHAGQWPISSAFRVAIFVAGNIPAGSTYQQYWAANGKPVFTGTSKSLKSAITTPRPVYMGFRKKGLKNGLYNFQFILDGRPHVLGSVTRKC